MKARAHHLEQRSPHCIQQSPGYQVIEILERNGESGRGRTLDLLIKSQLPLPAEQTRAMGAWPKSDWTIVKRQVAKSTGNQVNRQSGQQVTAHMGTPCLPGNRMSSQTASGTKRQRPDPQSRLARDVADIVSGIRSGRHRTRRLRHALQQWSALSAVCTVCRPADTLADAVLAKAGETRCRSPIFRS